MKLLSLSPFAISRFVVIVVAKRYNEFASDPIHRNVHVDICGFIISLIIETDLGQLQESMDLVCNKAGRSPW